MNWRARAFDTLARIFAKDKTYPKDPDPRHWKTINGSHVHLDKNGNYNGGAGGKFNGRHHYGPDWREKAVLMNRLASALHQGIKTEPKQSEKAGGEPSGSDKIKIEEQKARAKIKELQEQADEAYKKQDYVKGSKLRKEIAAIRDEAAAKGIPFISAAWESLDTNIKANHLVSRTVGKLPKKLNETEIVKRLAGGDKTEGSCSSVALAYIANKIGLDVLDFRGGDSRYTFGLMDNVINISKLNGIKSEIHKVRIQTSGGAEILTGLPKNKEFYFAIGGHAAIVRNTDSGLQYLELQSKNPSENGWTDFGEEKSDIMKTLRSRFGCLKSQKTCLRRKVLSRVIVMDVDSFAKSKEFPKLMEYINTNGSLQMKGAEGDAK